MEQVVYHLILLITPKCLKTVPWPVTNLKESAEFRNAITLIINVSLFIIHLKIIFELNFH